MPDTKIATCCYCGTRAALVLRGATRHELSCASCGAPLHDMKRLPADRASAPARKVPPRAEKPRSSHERWEKPKKRKKKKARGRKMLGELFDVIEDIFD